MVAPLSRLAYKRAAAKQHKEFRGRRSTRGLRLLGQQNRIVLQRSHILLYMSGSSQGLDHNQACPAGSAAGGLNHEYMAQPGGLRRPLRGAGRREDRTAKAVRSRRSDSSQQASSKPSAVQIAAGSPPERSLPKRSDQEIHTLGRDSSSSALCIDFRRVRTNLSSRPHAHGVRSSRFVRADSRVKDSH